MYPKHTFSFHPWALVNLPKNIKYMTYTSKPPLQNLFLGGKSPGIFLRILCIVYTTTNGVNFLSIKVSSFWHNSLLKNQSITKFKCLLNNNNKTYKIHKFFFLFLFIGKQCRVHIMFEAKLSKSVFCGV